MKFFLVFLLLCGLTYGSYTYYRQSTNSRSSTTPIKSQSNLVISQANSKFADLASVLGASIVNTIENAKEILGSATNGASEPIINELVTKTTETLKDLPRKEAEKIKYEFCKSVISEYENK